MDRQHFSSDDCRVVSVLLYLPPFDEFISPSSYSLLSRSLARNADSNMACPEIQLPPMNSEVVNSSSNSDIAKEEAEKHQNDSRSSIGLEGHNNEPRGEIVWHYLEFETPLPSPNLAQSNGKPPPECPNLKKYTSPFLWSETRKNLMTALSCLVTIIAAYNAGAYSPGVEQMSEEWNKGRVAVLVGITTFTVGFGIAPMFLAPFSELNGRRPVFVATGIVSLDALMIQDNHWKTNLDRSCLSSSRLSAQ